MPAPDIMTLVEAEFFAPANKLLETNQDLLNSIPWHEKHNENAIRKLWKDVVKEVHSAEKKFHSLNEDINYLRTVRKSLLLLYETSRKYFASMGGDVEEYTRIHRAFESRAHEVFEQIDRTLGKQDGVAAGKINGHAKTFSITDNLLLDSLHVRARVTYKYLPGNKIGTVLVDDISSHVIENMCVIVLTLFTTAIRNNTARFPSSFNLDVALKPIPNNRAVLEVHSSPNNAFITFSLSPAILVAAEKNHALPQDPQSYYDALHELTHFIDWRRVGREHFTPEIDTALLTPLREIVGAEPSILALSLASTINLARSEGYARMGALVEDMSLMGTFKLPQVFPKLQLVLRDIKKIFSSFSEPAYLEHLLQMRNGGEVHDMGEFMLFLSVLHRLILKKKVLIKDDLQGIPIDIVPSAVENKIQEVLFIPENDAFDIFDQELQKVRLNDWVSFLANYEEACKYFGIQNLATIESFRQAQMISLRTAA